MLKHNSSPGVDAGPDSRPERGPQSGTRELNHGRAPAYDRLSERKALLQADAVNNRSEQSVGAGLIARDPGLLKRLETLQQQNPQLGNALEPVMSLRTNAELRPVIQQRIEVVINANTAAQQKTAVTELAKTLADPLMKSALDSQYPSHKTQSITVTLSAFGNAHGHKAQAPHTSAKAVETHQRNEQPQTQVQPGVATKAETRLERHGTLATHAKSSENARNSRTTSESVAKELTAVVPDLTSKLNELSKAQPQIRAAIEPLVAAKVSTPLASQLASNLTGVIAPTGREEQRQAIAELGKTILEPNALKELRAAVGPAAIQQTLAALERAAPEMRYAHTNLPETRLSEISKAGTTERPLASVIRELDPKLAKDIQTLVTTQPELRPILDPLLNLRLPPDIQQRVIADLRSLANPQFAAENRPELTKIIELVRSPELQTAITQQFPVQRLHALDIAVARIETSLQPPSAPAGQATATERVIAAAHTAGIPDPVRSVELAPGLRAITEPYVPSHIAPVAESLAQRFEQRLSLGSEWNTLKSELVRSNPRIEPILQRIEHVASTDPTIQRDIQHRIQFTLLAQALTAKAQLEAEELREKEALRHAELLDRMTREEVRGQSRAKRLAKSTKQKNQKKAPGKDKRSRRRDMRRKTLTETLLNKKRRTGKRGVDPRSRKNQVVTSRRRGKIVVLDDE